MGRGLVTVGISVTLAFIGSVLILNWLVNDDMTKTFLTHATEEHRQTGIKELSLETKGSEILLNVELNRPMSCPDVIEILGVENLPLRGKLYEPVCTVIGPKVMVIVYKEHVKI